MPVSHRGSRRVSTNIQKAAVPTIRTGDRRYCLDPGGNLLEMVSYR
jgi:hypothetical protein